MGVGESVASLVTLSNLELTRFFLAIVLLLVSAYSFGIIFQKLRMPQVIGEIFGGLLLGPSFLGYFAPNIHIWIFLASEGEGKLLAMMSWFGLALLMFISGFAIERSFTRDDKKIATGLSLGAKIIPFLGGVLLTFFYDFTPYLGPNGNMISLTIIIAIATSITSIPVISKIFIDLGIIGTRFAKVTLATAVGDDIVLWALFALATGIAGAQIASIQTTVSIAVLTISFFGFGLVLIPRLIRSVNNSRARILITAYPSRFTLLVLFSLVALAALLNVNIVFGALIAGTTVGMLPNETFGKVRSHIKSISLGLFIPLYFAIVGLKLDFIHQFDLLFFLGFLLFSSAMVAAGTLMVGKFLTKNWLSSINLAFVLNARGGPGIVLATIAFELGLVAETFFTTLVLTAIITSLLAGFWLRYVLSKSWELLRA